MQAEQLDLVTKNPSMLRKLAVNYAIGHALVVRGMGPESPPPTAFAQRLLPVVEEAANALVDTALAGLSGALRVPLGHGTGPRRRGGRANHVPSP